MVRRAAIWPRPQKAQHHDLLDPGALCSFDDGLSAAHVHALVALIADLAVDSGAVRDRVAPFERSGERVNVVDVNAGATRDQHRVVKAFGEVAPDETSAAGNCNAKLCHVSTLLTEVRSRLEA